MQNLTRIISKHILITKKPPFSFTSLFTKKKQNNSTFAKDIFKMNLEQQSTRKTRSFKMKSIETIESGIEEEVVAEEKEETFEYTSKKMKLNKGVKEKLTHFVMGSQKNHEEVGTTTTCIPSSSSTNQTEDPQSIQQEQEEQLLPPEFWTVDPVTLAKNLLGKIIVRKIDGQLIKCRIVETEAYGGVEDKGCHAYGGKMTDRTKHLYQKGGHLYVYLIYGISCCMNITASIEGEPTAVLIRAVEIMEGYNFVVANRNMKNLSKIGKELTNGPGKLCAAMKIDKTHNTMDITKAGELFVTDGDNKPFEIVVSKRINIDYAKDYIDKPWRFYIKDNQFVSCKGTILEVISPFEKDETEITSVPSLLLESLDQFKAPPKSSSRPKKFT